MSIDHCPLCRDSNHKPCFSVQSYKLVICDNCGLFFITPYPAMDDVHSTVSRCRYDNLEIIDPDRHYRNSILNYDTLFSLIAPEIDGAASFLDVGCGTGHLLELAGRDTRLHRAGVELNSGRAEYARKKTRCEIFQTPIEQLNSGRQYDVITMINVLSHIPDFEKLFGSLKRLLTPDGKLILKAGEHSPKATRRTLPDWGIPDHLHFLGLNTIEYIADKYGFDILRHDRWPYSRDLFSPNRFKVSGRSKKRDLIKRIILHTPYALPILARAYDRLNGISIYSSLVIVAMK